MKKHDSGAWDKPISAWGYVGYSILFCIPIIGFILLIVFSVGDTNVNLKNYARSYFCWLLIGVVFVVVTMATGSIPVVEQLFKQYIH